MEERAISRFFEGINSGLKSLDEVKKTYNETMAFGFNIVDFIKPNENKISEILSYFLDPDEGHGQGKKFLEEFCEYISAMVKTKNNVEKPQMPLEKSLCVETEHSTDKFRRIDILITFGDNDFMIGIESKIYGASDQLEQLSHYSDYLQDRTNGKYILIYLTPNGDVPQKESIGEEKRQTLEKEGKLILMSAKTDLISIIDKFIAICKAHRVRYFLEEFRAYLKKGAELMNTQNYIQDFIVGSDNDSVNYDYIKVALNVHSTMQDADDIWNKLWTDVGKELSEYFLQEDYQVEFAKKCTESDLPQKELFIINTRKYKIYGEFCKPNSLSDPYFYVYKKSLSDKQIEKLKMIRFTSVDIPNGWLYENMYDYQGNWRTNTKPWLDMIKESGNRSVFAKKIIDEVEKINTALCVEDELCEAER